MNQHIEFVGRDHSGITTVVTSTGVLDAHAVVADIASGRASFVAGPSAWDAVPVRVRDALGVDYLYANWDGTRRNNLHDLATRAGGPGTAPARPSRWARTTARLARLVGVDAEPAGTRRG